MTEFDENGILHLRHDNYDLLPALSSGDRIVLWVSLLAAISKSEAINLRFILNRPFCRLDSKQSIQLAESIGEWNIKGLHPKNLIFIGRNLLTNVRYY
jgi:hypothetical protein